MNYYEILNIPFTASQDEIKTAFHKLAKENHPDSNPNLNDSDKMYQIIEAYKVLSNPERKRNYDLNIKYYHNYDYHENQNMNIFVRTNKVEEKINKLLDKIKKSDYRKNETKDWLNVFKRLKLKIELEYEFNNPNYIKNLIKKKKK